MEIKKLRALFVSFAMILSVFVTSVNVFAEGAVVTDHKITGTEAKPATIKLKKILYTDKGITLPNLTFNFTATKKSVNDVAVAHPDNDATMPTATINAITIQNSDKPANVGDNNQYKIEKESDVTFGNFSHAGKYEWTIAETAGTTADVTYDNNSYTLTAYVANKANSNELYIQTITVKNAQGTKVEKLEFVNRYAKNNGSLIISKSLADSNKTDAAAEGKHTENFNDKSKAFTFTIKLEKPASAAQNLTKVTAKYHKQNNQIEDKEIQFGQEQTFTLKDGEKLVFDSNLPIGTIYTVKENAVANYTPSAKVTQDGQVVQFDGQNQKSGTKNTELNAADGANKGDAVYQDKLFIGERENKVEFTNTYDFIVLTGIVMNNLPFILMVVVASLGFCMYTIAKKRRYSHS